LITATLTRDNSNINGNVNEQHFEFRPCSTFSTCCMFDILNLLYVRPVFDIIRPSRSLPLFSSGVTIGGLGSFWDLSGTLDYVAPKNSQKNPRKIPKESQKSPKIISTSLVIKII